MATEQSETAYDAYGRRKRPRPGSSRRVPFGRLLLFYLSLVAIAAVLSYYVPLFHDAWLASDISQVQSQGSNILEAQRGIELDPNPAHRALMTLLITLGALAISLPVAWVYTFTRRFRFDPSLVQSIIILPMVVAGIVLIVKNSVALAFSLAGIVAGVRFRNTLKDPKDAVYIFLALSIGLAAGVRASDVALVSSLIFNLVILIVWKYNLASVYAGDSKGPLFTIGDTTLLLANRAEQRAQLRERLKAEAGDRDADGFLLVHTDDVSAAMRGAELSVAKVAKEWKIVPKVRQRYEITTFAVLMELDGKKGNPLHLLAELDEEFSTQISAAEYVPFQGGVAEDEEE
jgi:hypothetical protein